MNLGSSKLDIYQKRPDEILPIDISFGKLHILPRRATRIVSAIASAKRWKRKFPQNVEGANDFLVSTTPTILTPSQTTVQVVTTGGLDGYDYVISLRVTFDNNAVLEDEIYVRVAETVGDINYIADTVTGGFNLNRLNDVTIANPQNNQLIRYNSTTSQWENYTANISGASDGDKGDITVSNSGNTWTVDNGVISYAKIQNVSATNKLLGRSSANAGVIEEITCTAAGRALLDDADAAAQRSTLGLGTLATQNGTSSGTNTGDQTITLTGDVTGSGTGSFAATIANQAVSYAKIQNVSATDKLLGRSSAGAGVIQEITCTAAGRALLDDIDSAAQRNTLGLGTLAIQNGTFSGISAGINTGDQTISLTGDVTGSGTGSFSATISNQAVTYAKIQNVSATDRILGRSSAGAGSAEEIPCTAAGRALIDDVDAAAQRATLGLGTLATQSGTLTDYLPLSGGALTGALTVVTVNKVAITAPATSATLTLANGSTLATSGANSLTLTTGGATNVTLPSGTATLVARNSTDTLTNKRIQPRITTMASASSLTPDVSLSDFYEYTALAAALTINNPTGAPVNGELLNFRFQDNGAPRALNWDTQFRSMTATLPTTTVANKTHRILCEWNSNTSTWDCLAANVQP